jgi:hypothetical protein
MTKLYQVIIQLSWLLGVAIMLLAVISKLMHLTLKLRVEPSTLLLLASTLFLCAVATRAMEQS